MRSKHLAITGLVAAVLICGCGSKESEETAAAAASTPKITAPPMTAAEHQKAINDNPNLSPAVKKVLGGGGR